MKKINYLPFIIAIAFLILSIMTANKTADIKTDKVYANATSNEVGYEMKGIWVSYITLDMQNGDNSENGFTQKFSDIVKKTKESGFNTLIVQVRPFCDSLYKSKYFPWSHILTGNQGENPKYDPLKIMCELCHKNEIKIHAWINPYRVKSVSSPSVLSEDNPYVKDKTIGFEYNNCIYLDPSNDNAIELIDKGVKEIVSSYDVDGIQFDDYFYPEGFDADDEKYNKYLNEGGKLEKEAWRMENVNKLVKKVYSTVHKYNKNAVFGISPQGNIKNNSALGADIYKWCENKGYIDYICPQIYFSLDNPKLTFENSLNQWKSIKKHSDLMIYAGLAGYKGGTDADEGTWLDNNDILKNEIIISQQVGLDGIILYSFDSFNNEENKEEIENVVNYLTGVTA